MQGCSMTIVLAPDIKHGVSIEHGERGYVSKRRGAGRIERLLVKIVAIEFLTVVGTSLLTSWAYFATVLTAQPPVGEYAGAALIIATLVVLIALGFKQHVAIQSQFSSYRYLWSAVGAVTLAFSLFLSLLFLFKTAEWYSRGTFSFSSSASA